MKTYAPWTPEQVDALNRWQRQAGVHPFTCGGSRGDQQHRSVAAKRGEADLGLLVATAEGWRCPACSYTQPWAHDFMLTA